MSNPGPIEWDYNFFPIICPLTTPIGVLKKLIKEERKNSVLSNVDATHLTLWKVDLAIPSGDERKDLTGKHLQGSVKLEDDLNNISDYWPETAQLNPKHLHIIVELPSFPDHNDQPLPKRPRFHNGRLQGWIQLPDDDPWKLFGDYWRKKEDPTYRLPLVAETKNKIIVRECYEPLYKYIRELRGKEYRGLVLSGQPGIGKTLWLSYALVRLLVDNETVVYYTDSGTYLFFGNSVYSRDSGAIPPAPADSATFCLIDLDHKTDPTGISFMTNKVLTNTFPVMASPPNPSRYKIWQKQRNKVLIEYMPLCNRDELKKGLKIQKFYDILRQDVARVLYSPSVDHGSMISPIRGAWYNLIVSAVETVRGSMVNATEGDLTEDEVMNDVTGDDATDNATVTVDEVMDKLLDNVIEAYGSSARDVYRAIDDPAVARLRIDNALTGLKYDSLREAVAKIGVAESESILTHTIFSMDPKQTIGNAHNPKPGDLFAVKFKSLWIRTLVLGKLDFLRYLETSFIIKEMERLTYSAMFLGFFYEGFSTKVLASGASQCLALTKMKAEKGTTTFFVPDESRHTIESPFNRRREQSCAISTGSLELEFDIPLGRCLSGYFWKPVAPNNPLFNAFVIEFNGSAPNINAVVWILQMTLSRDHGGSPNGYSIIRSIKKKVQEAIGTTDQRKGRKRKNVKVNYVLVSPEAGRWTLPKDNRSSCRGDVYYQRVNHHDTLHGT